MPMTYRTGTPPTVERERLITGAINLIAWGGTAAVTEDRVGRAARVSPRAVRTHFGSVAKLLLSATRTLAADPFLPASDHALPGHDADALTLLTELAHGHCRLVDAVPVRFAALLRITSAAVLAEPALVGPLAARQRRLNAECVAHLKRLRESGGLDPAADLPAAAGLFIEGLTGIALCHAIDRDDDGRTAAQVELCRTVAEQLASHPAR